MHFVNFFFSFLGVSTLFFLLESVNGSYDHSYIQEPCDNTNNRHFTLGSNGYQRYGIIEADNDGCYNPHSDCRIRLSVSPGYQITVRFDWISIELSDMLIIQEGNKTYPIQGYFTPPYSYYSTQGWMNFQFLTYADIYNCFGGFRLDYTSFHTGDCAENEFRCSLEGRCIPIELRCDRNDNCGDWSDEWNCGLSTGAIIGISVACAVAGIALIAAIFYGLYRKSHRRSADDHGRSSSYPHAGHTRTDYMTGAEPMGPPKYSDVPPAYGLTTTTTTINSNPVYEDLDHHGGVIPPTYHQTTFTTAPYNGQSHSSVTHYDNATHTLR